MSEPKPGFLNTPEAGSRSAGGMLRVAREAQGLTLDMLANTIKVAPAKLEALENDDFDKLPDAHFARALAMAVSRALKIDGQTVLSAMPEARPVPLASGREPINQPFKEAKVSSSLFDHGFQWRSLLTVKWVAPFVLLLAAALIYVLPASMERPAWLGGVRTTPVPVVVTSPSAPAVVVPVEPVPDGAVPDVAPTAASLAASVADMGSEGPGTAASAPPLKLDHVETNAPAPSLSADPRLSALPDARISSPLSASTAGAAPAAAGAESVLTLKVQAPSWIEVRDGRGNRLLSREVAQGEELSFSAEAPVSVRVGNASGVNLLFRGQAVDLGPYTRNNVARLELK
jgi:cytoskeleton protein RodZ